MGAGGASRFVLVLFGSPHGTPTGPGTSPSVGPVVVASPLTGVSTGWTASGMTGGAVICAGGGGVVCCFCTGGVTAGLGGAPPFGLPIGGGGCTGMKIALSFGAAFGKSTVA